ncbi:MFS transporter [Azohydromonas caseinilytica]|uniref:MFS transporter n=1 Tax=Azohydromonas caseinilytica TaxID=2728836 RepID=A0A848FEY0_9BURK|nr:MFS transporter [Azohydromonas caseinilytica]NML17842.1 MFS transporter [Azohydromonas caseinilytica]
MTSRSSPPIDIGHLLDDGPFSPMQRLVVALAALAIVMDGFDGQLIGFAIPQIIQEWGITRGAFAPAVAAGLFGMAVGSAGAGLFADRFGRRLALALSVFLFGAATCAIGFAPDVPTIAALRFIAGLGIGGALPSASTMTAEFTPARRRTLAVTATIVCYPLGGMLAGLFASAVLPAYGWRGLFWIGGTFPMVLSLLLLMTLPESPRFLARRESAWPRLRQLLARMDRPLPADTRFTDAAEAKATGRTQGGFAALFRGSLARDTLALSAAFFMCMLAVYSAFSWLPTMLAAEGLPVAVATSGLTAYNLGGVLGALGCAAAITRFGSRRPLLFSCLGAAGSALLMQGIDVSAHTNWLIVGLCLHGMFVNAVQATMYALCAHVYPTAVRATGTATALSLGRFGAILSSFAGAAVITAGGAAAYLAMLGVAMLFVLFALMAVRRHIPGRAHQPAAAPAPAASR